MGYTAIDCPKCGASINAPMGADEFYCQYCGTKIVKDVDYLEVSGSVSIKGMANENSLLQRALIFMEDGNYQRALEYIDRVLDITPKMAKAYFFMFLCQAKVSDIDELMAKVVNPHSCDSYNKAVRYSEGTEKQGYESIALALAAPIIKKRKQLALEIDNLEDAIHKQKREYEKLSKKVAVKYSDEDLYEYKQTGKSRKGSGLFFVTSLWTVLIFFTIFQDFSFFWIFLLSAAFAYVAFLRFKRLRKLPDALEQKEIEIAESQLDLESKKAELKMLG